MRKLGLSLALLVGATASVAAQGMPWRPEIGIKSTFGKVKLDDGTKLTMIDIPGGNGLTGYGGNASLYATFPVKSQWAVEPALGMNDLTFSGTNVEIVNASTRLMFSAFRGLYLGAGPAMALIKSDGVESTRWGFNAGVGYRFKVGGAVTGRAEVFYTNTGEDTDNSVQKSNEFGLAVGLGLGLRNERPARGASRGRSESRMWDWALGMQGGYAHISFPGQIEVTEFSLPGAGGEPAALAGVPFQSISPWFVQIPIGDRFALEPSFGYHKFKQDGGGDLSTYTVGLRGDYAFNRTFYGALSADLAGVGGSLFSGADGMHAIGGALGARFPLVGPLQGRTEVVYKAYAGGNNAFLPDHQVHGISFGIFAPLK